MTLSQNEGSPNNLLVKKLNADLMLMCKEKGIDYLDINSVLSKNEALIMDYSTDGTHLNEEGYNKWGDFLKTYFRKKDLY